MDFFIYKSIVNWFQWLRYIRIPEDSIQQKKINGYMIMNIHHGGYYG